MISRHEDYVEISHDAMAADPPIFDVEESGTRMAYLHIL